MGELLGQQVIVDYRTSNSPEQMLKLAKEDGAQIDKIIRTAGIRIE